MSLKRELKTATIGGFATSMLFVLIILNILLENLNQKSTTVGYNLLELNAKEGVSNAVTSVVVYFRGIDTLGEIAVLFIASLGIGLMLNSKNSSDVKLKSNFMLNSAAKLMFPFLLMFGLYIMFYGHLSPGGGFQGGVVVASAVLLLLISQNDFRLPHSVVSIFEVIAGASYVIIGLIGLFVFDNFLGNILPNDISNMGMFLSGGIIPIIYIIVGIKVGSEMSMIVQNLIKRDDNV